MLSAQRTARGRNRAVCNMASNSRTAPAGSSTLTVELEAGLGEGVSGAASLPLDCASSVNRWVPLGD